ncbi:MAG: RNA-binding protein [Candidatus Thermoplasmatota archaeon]|nr:RNA-binding protein [Candidatus Thermoplasmatota archaeon]
MPTKERQIVIPGQMLGTTSANRAGRGTFIEKGKIYAERLGVLNMQDKFIHIIALKGRYDPVVGDMVIGVVEEAATSNWMVDINAPYPALLHVNEVPWEIEFADTEKYLNTGDTILAKVLSVDESKKLQVTLNDRNLFKLKGGHIIEFEPSLYRRIIGKKFSMIEIIQKYSRCRIKVGKNGRIWIDGEADGIEKVLQAIATIESEAISYGLTSRIEGLLKKDTKDVR